MLHVIADTRYLSNAILPGLRVKLLCPVIKGPLPNGVRVCILCCYCYWYLYQFSSRTRLCIPDVFSKIGDFKFVVDFFSNEM